MALQLAELRREAELWRWRPQSRDEIVAALQALHEESEAYWQSVPTHRFLASIGLAWSPAENVRHLTKSMRAVTTGRRVPRSLLSVRFGRAKVPSCSFETLHAVYGERRAPGRHGWVIRSERSPAVTGR